MKAYSRYIILFLAAIVCGSAYSMPGADVAAVEQLSASTDITVRSGGVEVSNHTDAAVQVAVYDITGRKIKETAVDSGQVAFVELPKGCFIVKAGRQSKRVLVR